MLTDFGISKIFDAKGDGVQIVDTVRTLVKVREGRSLVMGSLGYMAPELEMGVAASPQSDWYALGVIVYRLLTGTWCDARTDIVGTLETYDPVWKRILPKLLHANPNGRECLSYAEERRADREKTEFELEERWLKEKDRGHRNRHIARYAAAAAVGIILALLFFWRGFKSDLAIFKSELRDAAELVDLALEKIDSDDWDASFGKMDFDDFDDDFDEQPKKGRSKSAEGVVRKDRETLDAVRLLLERAARRLQGLLAR